MTLLEAEKWYDFWYNNNTKIKYKSIGPLTNEDRLFLNNYTRYVLVAPPYPSYPKER